MVTFYEALPRGPAPKPKIRGFTDWYHQKYMGENESAMRKDYLRRVLFSYDSYCSTAIVHVVGFLMAIGYAQNYYFHLSELRLEVAISWRTRLIRSRTP